MSKLHFDTRLQAHWQHPDLDQFVNAEEEPIFFVDDLDAEATVSDPFEELEGIAYRHAANVEGFCFSMEQAHVAVNQDFSRIFISSADRALIDDTRYQAEIGRLLHTVFAYRMLHVNGLSLHAAVAVNHSDAIAFCGLSGAGKSTQANLWHEHIGSWILNYDKPVIRYDSSGRCLIHGTPWSGKERRFVNASVPLKAIVFVEQAPFNRVDRVSEADAFSLLWLNNYVYPLEERIENLYDAAIEKLSLSIPVYRLYCTKTIEAVHALYRVLYDEADYENTIERGKNKMKIKNGFVLRNIADEYIVIPRGKATLQFQSTIVLNETGAFLWEIMKEATTESALVSRLVAEYEVSHDIASVDVAKFIAMLRENQLIEDYE